jgi:arylsulfatase A-like enzyme
VQDALSDLTDILPTCAELGGATLLPDYIFDGVSLADIILGKPAETSREWIMSMGGNGGGSSAALSEKGLENQYRFRDRVVRDKEYKLFVSYDRSPEKLISVMDDPEEKTNLIQSDDPKVKAEYEKLWKVVLSFPEKDNDPNYNPLPRQPWDKEITVHSQIWKK